MTISEFVKMQVDGGMTKTSAVNLAVELTGISSRSAWMQVDSGNKTPKAVARLLDVFVAADISQKAKKRLFPEAFA